MTQTEQNMPSDNVCIFFSVLFLLTLLICFGFTLSNNFTVLTFFLILLIPQVIIISVLFVRAYKIEKKQSNQKEKEIKPKTEIETNIKLKPKEVIAIFFSCILIFIVSIGGLFIFMEMILVDSFPTDNIIIQAVSTLVAVILLLFASYVNIFLMFCIVDTVANQ